MSTHSDIITPEHLPENMRQKNPAMLSDSVDRALSIEEYTKAVITRYQDRLGEQKIAELLGITRKSLWEKRKRWDIRRTRE